jgi:hypothetical protein
VPASRFEEVHPLRRLSARFGPRSSARVPVALPADARESPRREPSQIVRRLTICRTEFVRTGSRSDRRSTHVSPCFIPAKAGMHSGERSPVGDGGLRLAFGIHPGSVFSVITPDFTGRVSGYAVGRSRSRSASSSGLENIGQCPVGSSTNCQVGPASSRNIGSSLAINSCT